MGGGGAHMKQFLFCQVSKPVISAWPQLKRQVIRNSQVGPEYIYLKKKKKNKAKD